MESCQLLGQGVLNILWELWWPLNKELPQSQYWETLSHSNWNLNWAFFLPDFLEARCSRITSFLVMRCEKKWRAQVPDRALTREECGLNWGDISRWSSLSWSCLEDVHWEWKGNEPSPGSPVTLQRQGLLFCSWDGYRRTCGSTQSPSVLVLCTLDLCSTCYHLWTQTQMFLTWFKMFSSWKTNVYIDSIASLKNKQNKPSDCNPCSLSGKQPSIIEMFPFPLFAC